MFIIIEAARQIRGECGERQVRDAEVAICHAPGGIFSGMSTMSVTNAPPA
jgi:hypothetical protein